MTFDFTNSSRRTSYSSTGGHASPTSSFSGNAAHVLDRIQFLDEAISDLRRRRSVLMQQVAAFGSPVSPASLSSPPALRASSFFPPLRPRQTQRGSIAYLRESIHAAIAENDFKRSSYASSLLETDAGHLLLSRDTNRSSRSRRSSLRRDSIDSDFKSILAEEAEEEESATCSRSTSPAIASSDFLDDNEEEETRCSSSSHSFQWEAEDCFHFEELCSSFEKMPILNLLPFLTADDTKTLASVSSRMREACSKVYSLSPCYSPPATILHHLYETSINPRLTLEEADDLVIQGIATDQLESLTVSIRNPGSWNILKAINRNGIKLPNLKKFAASCAVDSKSFPVEIETLFENSIRENQLTGLAFSGFDHIERLFKLVRTQAHSLVSFNADYFCKGHEREVKADSEFIFCSMPNIRSFVLDVAEDVDVDASMVLRFINDLKKGKSQLAKLYIPHIRIGGTSESVAEFVRCLSELSAAKQIVAQFTHMPFAPREVIAMRRSMIRLPAVCIADHFIVAQSTWASWWTPLAKLWQNADSITGLSVFREQIDFGSLGTSAIREWLKMSKEEKKFWDVTMVEAIRTLYLNDNSPPAPDNGSSTSFNFVN